MSIFDLDEDYSVSFFPYRTHGGYTAKGTVFCRGKIVEIFEARGRTLPATSEAAQTQAHEIWKRLKAVKKKRVRKTR